MQIGSLFPGDLPLRNSVALAPMAGLSDVPLRTLAWRFGAGHMVTEMVSSKPELWDTGKSRLRRIPVAGAPLAVQIAGTDPDVMADAARRHADDGVELIDLNFGCPAKKVCRKAAGSALLADPKLIGRIVGAVAAAVPIPVTVKTRTGLTPADDLGVQAARIAVDSGARMVVMHARSRACRFKGPVDYARVRRVKELVDVPVLVNGDIDGAAQARAAMAASGADGVMIGRGAMGQPWIFAALTGGSVPTRAQQWQVAIEHVRMLHDFYGVPDGARIARKHVIEYLRRFGCEPAARDFLRLDCGREQLAWLTRRAELDSEVARRAA